MGGIIKSRKLFGHDDRLRQISEHSVKSVRRAIDYYDIDHIFLMSSGGNDSSVLVSWFHQVMRDEIDKKNIDYEVGHIDTEIGIEETRQFAEKFARERELPFKRVSVTDVKNDENYSSVKSFEEFVKENGFPGPGQHSMAYSWLKYRPILKMTKDAKENYQDRILFLTGVRSDESTRRMGNTVRFQRDGARVWSAPIMHWTNLDMNRYRKYINLERNPVSDKVHMSGECLCGAYASDNEREEIRFFFPDVIEEIEELEKEVKDDFQSGECGFSNEDYTKWAHGRADGEFSAKNHPLCVGCGDRMGMRENQSEGSGDDS